MSFQQLLRLLEKEISLQEKLLELLVKERAAIVKLNQEQVEAIALEKAQLLER